MQYIENVDLSNLEFAVLLACETAQDYDVSHIENNTPVNYVEQMILCGAETVIGFTGQPEVKDGNHLAWRLVENMITEDMTVTEAITVLSSKEFDEDIKSIILIAGNENKRFRED